MVEAATFETNGRGEMCFPTESQKSSTNCEFLKTTETETVRIFRRLEYYSWKESLHGKETEKSSIFSEVVRATSQQGGESKKVPSRSASPDISSKSISDLDWTTDYEHFSTILTNTSRRKKLPCLAEDQDEYSRSMPNQEDDGSSTVSQVISSKDIRRIRNETASLLSAVSSLSTIGVNPEDSNKLAKLTGSRVAEDRGNRSAVLAVPQEMGENRKGIICGEDEEKSFTMMRSVRSDKDVDYRSNLTVKVEFSEVTKWQNVPCGAEANKKIANLIAEDRGNLSAVLVAPQEAGERRKGLICGEHEEKSSSSLRSIRSDKNVNHRSKLTVKVAYSEVTKWQKVPWAAEGNKKIAYRRAEDRGSRLAILAVPQETGERRKGIICRKDREKSSISMRSVRSGKDIGRRSNSTVKVSSPEASLKRKEPKRGIPMDFSHWIRGAHDNVPVDYEIISSFIFSPQEKEILISSPDNSAGRKRVCKSSHDLDLGSPREAFVVWKL